MTMPHLSKQWIDSHAYGIIKALQKKGHTTYLVGGCIRDLLIGKKPKDFDIATTASPYEIRGTIHQAYVIGKRFRLVLVKRNELQYEVATFRRNLELDENSEDHPPGDNIFGTPQEDAQRRDFTINGLFYDPVKGKLIDYANGLSDLNDGVVRMIGVPDVRLKEDPIRILRCIRLSHMVRFAIDPALRESIFLNSDSLLTSALPRRREEILKFLKLPEPAAAFLESYDLKILKYTAPILEEAFSPSDQLDTFLHYLFHFHLMTWNDPQELFAGFILAYYRAYIEADPWTPIKTKDFLEHPKLLSLMRDELGMFKYEQENIAKAFHLQALLVDPDHFLNEDKNQSMTLFKNPAFPIALKFAERDYTMPVHSLQRWKEEYDLVKDEIETYNLNKKKNMKRRKYPRKPRPKHR